MSRREKLGGLLASAVFLVAGCARPDPVPSPTAVPAFDRVERFAIAGRPSAIAFEMGKILVADDENHVVHILDGASGEEEATVEVDPDPIAIDGDAGVAWVAHAGGELSRIDVRDAVSNGSVHVGGSLTDVVAEDGGVWVVDHKGSSAAEIDPTNSQVIRGVTIPQGAVRGAVGKEGLWVSGTQAAISRVQLEQFVVRHVYPKVGGGPTGLAWDGHVMWAAISDDGTIIDVEGKTYQDPIKVGHGPIALAVLGDAVWVANQDDSTLSIVRDGEQVETVDIDVQPRDITTDGKAIWVVGTNQEAVVRVEP